MDKPIERLTRKELMFMQIRGTGNSFSTFIQRKDMQKDGKNTFRVPRQYL